jgi:hypothetical protein
MVLNGEVRFLPLQRAAGMLRLASRRLFTFASQAFGPFAKPIARRGFATIATIFARFCFQFFDFGSQLLNLSHQGIDLGQCVRHQSDDSFGSLVVNGKDLGFAHLDALDGKFTHNWVPKLIDRLLQYPTFSQILKKSSIF